MSVLIKGMKMPLHCWQCGLMDEDNNCTAMYATRREFASVMETWGEGRRPDWCPLIELPDHGDLIDIDRMIDDFAELRDYDFASREYVVIPAERSEDE